MSTTIKTCMRCGKTGETTRAYDGYRRMTIDMCEQCANPPAPLCACGEIEDTGHACGWDGTGEDSVRVRFDRRVLTLARSCAARLTDDARVEILE